MQISEEKFSHFSIKVMKYIFEGKCEKKRAMKISPKIHFSLFLIAISKMYWLICLIVYILKKIKIWKKILLIMIYISKKFLRNINCGGF